MQPLDQLNQRLILFDQLQKVVTLLSLVVLQFGNLGLQLETGQVELLQLGFVQLLQ